ncbi:MAG TPA: hypothetical protein VER76_09795, partial [Pyrinomonadaceae bacterium]|nr:hypothetical protein [Pyrinomonadaceae bacterium]
ADAFALAEEIRERIRRERGIELEYEVELWRSGNNNVLAEATGAGEGEARSGEQATGEQSEADKEDGRG